MFEGIHNKTGCLNRPPPHSGSHYPPPPVILTCCIHKTISCKHACESVLSDPVPPAELLWPPCYVPFQNQSILHEDFIGNILTFKGKYLVLSLADIASI